jgi:methylated-DNA-protein-cysteine methyltransferase related protein
MPLIESQRMAFFRAIRRVPRGKVATYGSIAEAAGFPGSARQVAWALHSSGGNLPWHRIVGAGGRILLGGNLGFEQKIRLEAEGVAFRGIRVRMDQHEYRFDRRKRA